MQASPSRIDEVFYEIPVAERRQIPVVDTQKRQALSAAFSVNLQVSTNIKNIIMAPLPSLLAVGMKSACQG